MSHQFHQEIARLVEADEATVIARRKTSDGKLVLLWSDGSISGAMSYQIKGVPMTKDTQVGWLFVSEVELYSYAELPALYKAAKWAAKRNGNHGDVRARVGKLLTPKPMKLKPIWTVVSTDRDGKPTDRYWKLDRVRWPGLVVWDHVNQGRGGRYEVASIDRNGTINPNSGVRVRTMGEVAKYLATVRVSYS